MRHHEPRRERAARSREYARIRVTRRPRVAWATGAGAAVLALSTIVLPVTAVGAIDVDGLEQVPAPIDGDAVYVPWVADGDIGITLDGDLADWAGVPTIVTNTGPLPSSDPSTTGELTWSVVAEGSKLFVAATITDDSIVAGQHEENYWNEDSIEVYLNATDDIDAATYGPGIAQVRFAAVDIGNTDPTALTLTGTNVDTFAVEGFVFATPDGWGVEGVIDFSQWREPSHGESLGFQMHANGASTLDRDLKLIWSNADTDDLSFDTPSVYGTAVIFELGQTDVPAPAERIPSSATSTTSPTTAVTSTTSTTEAAPSTPTTPATDEEAAPATEDTAILPDPDPASEADDDDAWTRSPWLWIVPLTLGIASLATYAMGRFRSTDPGSNDPNGDDPTQPV